MISFGTPPTIHLQQAPEAMYAILYAKVQINSDIYGKVIFGIGVKQRMYPFPHINRHVH